MTHRPSEPLARFVDYWWWLSDRPAHARERIVPTGTQEVVINLDADVFEIRQAERQGEARRFSGAMVSGAYSKYFVIDTRAHASLVGIHFKPGGARALLSVPLGELADRHVDLELIWGSQARELRERLGSVAGTRERFRMLEAAMLERLARDPGSDGQAAVRLALRRLTREQRGVGEVARELGLSGRRFIELFSAEVGMTPKVFGRVHRFQHALARARAPGGAKAVAAADWTQLALGAGYYDQSHLIRDFVTFSGFSPCELLRHTGPAPKEHHATHASKIRPRRA